MDFLVEKDVWSLVEFVNHLKFVGFFSKPMEILQLLAGSMQKKEKITTKIVQ